MNGTNCNVNVVMALREKIIEKNFENCYNLLDLNKGLPILQIREGESSSGRFNKRN